MFPSGFSYLLFSSWLTNRLDDGQKGRRDDGGQKKERGPRYNRQMSPFLQFLKREREKERRKGRRTINDTLDENNGCFRLRAFGHYIGRNALFYEVPLLLDRLSSLSLNGKASLSLGPVTSISLLLHRALFIKMFSRLFSTMMDPFLGPRKIYPAIV